MPKYFTAIVSGLRWVGKALTNAGSWVPKVLRIADDVAVDGGELLPRVVDLMNAADALVVAAVKDNGASVVALEELVAAIVAASKVDGLDIESDEMMLVTLQSFIGVVTKYGTWQDVLPALQNLVAAYDALGADSAAALAKLEADAKS